MNGSFLKLPTTTEAEHRARLRQCECCHRALEIGNKTDFCSGSCAYRHERELCGCFSGAME